MKIGRALYDEIVAHAREDAPDECCGMIAADDGTAVRVYRATNAEASPVRYSIDANEIYRVTTEIERGGLDLGAIYHSHTRSAPYPSQTDINLALTPNGEHELWPGTLYVIVGVANAEPDVRAFRIVSGGKVEEATLEVV